MTGSKIPPDRRPLWLRKDCRLVTRRPISLNKVPQNGAAKNHDV